MTKVLYIGGLYRSGSTILDILLGNQAGLVGVGELRNLPLIGWGHDGPCACGERIEDCSVWRDVRSDWERRVGPGRVARLAELQDRFERIRNIPRVVVEGLVGRSKSFREYSDLVAALYTAIAGVSAAEVVVDSTKYPARALGLLRNPDVELYFVHLVRDGRAVIWSMRRQLNTDLGGQVLEIPAGRIATQTTRQWLLTNLACDLVARWAKPNAIRVRYEDLVEDPVREVARIGRLIGIDTSSLGERVSRGDLLDVGHSVAGNRVRMGGPVRLKPDTEWRTMLSAEERGEFWRSAGWLARSYGYSNA